MTTLNTVTLNAPSINITGQVGGVGEKRLFCLESLAMLYECLPADTEIIRSMLWSQQGTDYPTGCYGEISWAVDRGVYSKLACPPAQEKCEPFALDMLGRLMFRTGADVHDQREHAEAIICRPGYRLLTAFEVSNAPGRPFSIFPSVRVRSVTGFVPLEGVVYHNLLNGTVNAPGFSYRSLIAGIPQGGSEIRVTIQSLEDGCAASHVSIGVRAGSSGFNMSAAPVQLSFDGASTPGLVGHTYKRSAWAPLATAAGQSLLVHSCVTGGHAYKEGAGPSCWVSGIAGHDTANFGGTAQETLTHMVAMIEVR